MRIPFRLVDVFTDRPFAGNQLCVIPDPVELPDDVRQDIAREIGFSETTFVTQVSEHRYAMRIFTPGRELPFAGHPSLGTAFVLASEGRVARSVVQEIAAGRFAIEVDVEGGSAQMEQLAPTFWDPLVGEVEELAAAVGLQPADLDPQLPLRLVSTGFPHLMCPLRDEDALTRAHPDVRLLGPLLERLGTDGCYLFRAEGARVRARLFAPGAGIVEDPATGSAAGPLGAYLVEHGVAPPGRISITQGVEMHRPSTLIVDVQRDGEEWRVLVGGGVVFIGEGAFEIPV
jgi:trans-2,3-dihydro-3-hydroxyanthranilate isomerase